MKVLRNAALALVATGAMSLGAAYAATGAENPETEIGTKSVGTLDIGAVYLNPIEMEPHGIDMPAAQADVHLEADIHARKGNPNGFGAGEWIPSLTVSYTLLNKSTGKKLSGNLMPMVASDGPHYGSNIKMPGTGNYHLSFHVDPPSKQGFGRHTDKATGVGPWFQPFDVQYDFSYVQKKKR